MKFDRNHKHQLLNYYQYFFDHFDWMMKGVPEAVGDWYLLVALGPSALEYPSNLAAIFVHEEEGEEPHYIYVEVTEDKLQSLAISEDVEEIYAHLPKRALRAVNGISGNMLSSFPQELPSSSDPL